MSKTETPDIVERLRRDLETLRPYIGRPIGGEGSAARREQENKQAAYVEAVEILHDLARLRDPVTVHRNMLHGSIAKPSWANILHLYPEQRDEIERLRSELAKHQWRTIESAPRDREILVVGGTAYDSMSTLTKRGAVQLAGFLSQEVTYTGSIQGHVHSIGVAELFFQLRRMRTNELIRCEFKEDLYQEILDACEPRNSRIFVHGKITARRVDRHISLIRVDGVRSAPRLSDEKYSSFFGYDPNYTGDISSVEFSERATRYEQ